MGPPNQQKAVPLQQQQEREETTTVEQPASLVVWSVGFKVESLARLSSVSGSPAAAADAAATEDGRAPIDLLTTPRGLLFHTDGCVLPPQEAAGTAVVATSAATSYAAAKTEEPGKKAGGLYVSGWFKHGPRGTIADSVFDAQQTAQRVWMDLTRMQHHQQRKQQQQDDLKDTDTHNAPPAYLKTSCPAADPDSHADPQEAPPVSLGVEALDALLRARGVRVVTFEGWKDIHREETRRGRMQGRVAAKITSIEQMLQLAGA